MTEKIKLLDPIVTIEKITKDKFHTLPPTVQMLAHNYDHVGKATITPRRAPGPGICRVKMVTPDSFKTGKLIVENGRRVPIEDPAPGQDDLRPIIFYGIGTGTQISK